MGSQGKKLPQYIAALSVCLGSVAAGTVLGWTSNISDKLRNGELNDIPIDADELGWIGSFATIGGMLMCFPIGYICDLIGRKWGCITTVVPFTIGWLLIILADNVGMLYAGRFLTGLAGGAFCVAAPIYSSEIAQKEIRGTLGSFFQLLLTCGILLAYIAGAYMTPRGFSILCAVIPIIFAVVFFFQPETPVYLLKKQNPEAALKSLRRLRGPLYNCEDEINEIKATLDQDATIKVSFFQAATTKASKMALLICFGLMFFQQMSGINAVIFYTGDIFIAAGSTLKPAIATIIVGVMQVVATFVSSSTVDRFGRKILLLSSIFFMMLSGFVLGIFFSLKDRKVIDQDGVDSISFLPILCLIIFICAFSLGFGPIPWLISAELMPQEIKSTACSAAATFNWLLAFLVTRFYGNLTTAIGGDSTFYIFGVLSLLGTVFVIFIVPETKGKSFTEVQELLGGDTTNNTTATNSRDKEGIDNPSFKN